MSLLWRVFAANVVVAVIAFGALAWAPVTVDRVATPSELVVLSIGLVVMLALDLVILRGALGPLRRLASVMSSVDPRQPGRRAARSSGAAAEVVALAEALNAMLDRLELAALVVAEQQLARALNLSSYATPPAPR